MKPRSSRRPARPRRTRPGPSTRALTLALLALGGCATEPPTPGMADASGGAPAPLPLVHALVPEPPKSPFYEPPAAPPAGLRLDPRLSLQPANPATARTPAERLRLIRENDVVRLLGGFTLAGKVSVAANSLPANADITWVQQGADFDMHLVGTFGAGATRVSSQDGTVTIRTKGGEFITTDPETDLRERLGYAVPVLGLRYWALGLPMPTNPPAEAVYDGAGHPVLYRQGAWTVEYADWRVTDGHDLPRRLEARTATADNRDEARFRLAITDWTFGAPPALPEPAAMPTPAGPAAAPAP